MKVGDIVELTTGPYRVTTSHYFPDGACEFTSYDPIEGPLTKKQHAFCDEEREQDERQVAKALALRIRIRDRIESHVGARIIPGSTSEEALKPLIDVIVELIHEESEY